MLIDQHDEWQVSQRHLSETSMTLLRQVITAMQHVLDTGDDYCQQLLVDQRA
ncbi:hypothetical protein [Dietzia sp. Die43]|uniref:hypothetical protein n=1 Tax=Dietzia sp. Die43 TaxID=2926011 RepID=UPI002118D7A1|nr:hypothetical protein [Dietzia sp. Die43]